MGPRTEAAGFPGYHLADNQVVKKHPDAGEVLLDGRRRFAGGKLLDVGSDEHGVDLFELVNLVGSAPIEKLRHGLGVGRARILIS